MGEAFGITWPEDDVGGAPLVLLLRCTAAEASRLWRISASDRLLLVFVVCVDRVRSDLSVKNNSELSRSSFRSMSWAWASSSRAACASATREFRYAWEAVRLSSWMALLWTTAVAVSSPEVVLDLGNP